ncbi:hypothetical protein DQX05_23950 [Paenibacillus thiaminolyticus]|uniref:Uncharacterized protein n=1 Tax=Paenibacillus thiaminolyticus TaxID=49283 RepID=A0A3A3GDV9_PANTH|nr:hypothetical protein DQX05_23950 [Paenibacillus thiaminolyticus]
MSRRDELPADFFVLFLGIESRCILNTYSHILLSNKSSYYWVKKLENNDLWESSRMIIPQHKEALLMHQCAQHHRERRWINVDDILGVRDE